ncbi:MAG: dTDP-4-dehydrorhamnose 3,5-epimerase [Flavobacteriaceae bacterium]|nr:dTDP-4-dehydrorhamnose 3,5-epimerase [Flavobacteriaceae bacterium]
MQIKKTYLKGLLIIEPVVFKDNRGYFFESYNKDKLAKLNINFVQDNESLSQKNVLRGLHFQKPPFAQDKLVRVTRGAVLDVVIDLRKSSETFGKHFAIKLSAKNKKQLFIPKSFAHGFLTLKKNTVFNYKCSNFYKAENEVTINCFDKDLNIDWKTANIILSDRDKNAINFSSFESPF